ncbi:MAG: type II toxin-antitoxin system RelB/DinJ family antitoxin [Actinomycetota bacterium]|nr:type II toxin-antitoxin system RelB/DinJ family antitoxin [Actinomycetota bacterium]
MRLKTTPHSFNLRMDDEQHAELGQLAAAAGLPVQQYIELQLFGRIRPRFDPRAPRKNRDQLTLPTEDEERPLDRSA